MSQCQQEQACYSSSLTYWMGEEGEPEENINKIQFCVSSKHLFTGLNFLDNYQQQLPDLLERKERKMSIQRKHIQSSPNKRGNRNNCCLTVVFVCPSVFNCGL